MAQQVGLGAGDVPRQASRPSIRNPLLTISSLLSTAVGTTSTGIPRFPQGLHLLI